MTSRKRGFLETARMGPVRRGEREKEKESGGEWSCGGRGL
jgi:hypothetical protein